MSTNELTLTLVGWLGTDPKHYPGTPAAPGAPGAVAATGNASTPFTTFRIASTRRWFDRERGLWVDGRTEWFTVKAWRGAARNVAESLRKGDPVLVHGRLSTEEWSTADGESRTSLVLDAIAIGPDLAYGTARYARTVHTAGSDPQDGAEGTPTGTTDVDGTLSDADLADLAGSGDPSDVLDDETAYRFAEVRDDGPLALSGTR